MISFPFEIVVIFFLFFGLTQHAQINKERKKIKEFQFKQHIMLGRLCAVFKCASFEIMSALFILYHKTKKLRRVTNSKVSVIDLDIALNAIQA